MPSFSHPDCSFSLFIQQSLPTLPFYSFYLILWISFLNEILCGLFRGLGKGQGRTLSRQWKQLVLPLPCCILTTLEERPDFAFRKERCDAGLLNSPTVFGSHPWAKFGWRLGLSWKVPKGWTFWLLTDSSDHWDQHRVRKCLFSSDRFTGIPAFLFSWRILFFARGLCPVFLSHIAVLRWAFATVTLLNRLGLFPHCGRSSALSRPVVLV